MIYLFIYSIYTSAYLKYITLDSNNKKVFIQQWIDLCLSLLLLLLWTQICTVLQMHVWFTSCRTVSTVYLLDFLLFFNQTGKGCFKMQPLKRNFSDWQLPWCIRWISSSSIQERKREKIQCIHVQIVTWRKCGPYLLYLSLEIKPCHTQIYKNFCAELHTQLSFFMSFLLLVILVLHI